MKVDSQAKVTNLNVDEIDGKDSADYYAAGSKVANASHADSASSAKFAYNANSLNGKQSSDFAPRAVACDGDGERAGLPEWLDELRSERVVSHHGSFLQGPLRRGAP